MIAWGLVMTLMCLVNSFQSLVMCVNRICISSGSRRNKQGNGRARLFLGFAEAGLFPGVNYYICQWYPRSERSKRIAIFFSAVTIAGMRHSDEAHLEIILVLRCLRGTPCVGRLISY
jgi:hypothetical protein